MNNDYQPPLINDFAGQYRQPNNGSGFAVASLVLGILSIVMLLFCSGINLIAAILAIVFAFVAKAKCGKMPTAAIIGLILGVIGIVVTVCLIGFVIYVLREALLNPEGEIASKVDAFCRQYYGIGWNELINQTTETANILLPLQW